MATLSELMVKIGADTSGFDKGIKEVQTSTTKMSGKLKGAFSKVSSGFMNIAKGVGKVAGAVGVFKVVDAGLNAISSSISGAVSRVDTLNQFPRVLQQMGYSATDAEKATKRLADGIDGLPTRLDEITGTTQRFVNVFQDVDLATESALALNNAFLASGASTDEAGRGMDQYIKILSTGKVEMDSWTTLQETMPYAMQKVAESFGYTGRSAQNDLYKALQSGQITVDQLNERFIELSNETGGFAEIAKTATAGIGTSMQNLKTAVTNGVAGIITAFDDWLNAKGFGGISGVIDRIKNKTKVAFSAIAEAIPVVLAKFEELYNTIKNSTAFQVFKDIVVTTFSTIVEIVSTIFGQVIEIVQTIVGQIRSAWETHGEGIVTKVSDIFSSIYETISSILSDATAFIQEKLQIVKDFWSQNGEQIMTAVSNVWNGILSIIQFIMPLIQTIIEFVWESIKGVISGALDFIMGLVKTFSSLFTGDWSGMWEGIKQMFSGAIEFILNIFNLSFVGGLKKLVTNLVKNVVKWIKGLWDEVGIRFMYGKDKVVSIMKTVDDFIQKIWDAIVKFVSNIVQGLWNTLKTIFNGIKNTIQTILNAIKNIFQTIWNAIKDVVSSVSNGISSTLSAVWNGIKSVITSILNGIKSVVTSIWNGIKNTISTVVNGVKSTVTNVFNSVKSSVSSIFNGIKSTATSVWNGIKNAITNPIESAKTTVLGIIDKIKGAFSKMKIKIPKPKLPKINVGSKKVLGISIPTFSIDWNAKGAIFDGASILGGGQGVGEAGAEAVLPIQHKRYMRPFASAVADHLDAMSPDKNNEPVVVENIVHTTIELDGEVVGRKVEKFVSREQLNRQIRTNRRSR